MDNTSQNMEFDNYDGQKFYYCTINFALDGSLVTDDFCIIGCKNADPSKCIWRGPASDYVTKREKLDKRRC